VNDVTVELTEIQRTASSYLRTTPAQNEHDNAEPDVDASIIRTGHGPFISTSRP
jgi:hypothetical protein